MLGDYLRSAARRPWQPGRHDCCAFPARWAGIDLPVYSTEGQAQAIVAEAPDLLRFVAPLLDARFSRIDSPEEGDIGVIVAVGMDRQPVQVGAIFTGKRWAFASPRGGIACASAEPLAVWRV